jgi:hypothetical protein
MILSPRARGANTAGSTHSPHSCPTCRQNLSFIRRHASPDRLGPTLITEFYRCDFCDNGFAYTPAGLPIIPSRMVANVSAATGPSGVHSRTEQRPSRLHELDQGREGAGDQIPSPPAHMRHTAAPGRSAGSCGQRAPRPLQGVDDHGGVCARSTGHVAGGSRHDGIAPTRMKFCGILRAEQNGTCQTHRRRCQPPSAMTGDCF